MRPSAQAPRRPVGALPHEPAPERGVQIAAGAVEVPATILQRVFIEGLPFPVVLAAGEDDPGTALPAPRAIRSLHGAPKPSARCGDPEGRRSRWHQALRNQCVTTPQSLASAGERSA